MVLLGVVLGKCEMPSTDISQENDHAILIVKRQFVTTNSDKQQWTYITFFPKSFL
jgi:hypothetical protein